MSDGVKHVLVRSDAVPGDTPGVNVARHDRFRLLATGPKPKVAAIGETPPDSRDVCIELPDDAVIAAPAVESPKPKTQPVATTPTSWKPVVLAVAVMVCATAFAISWFCIRPQPSRYEYRVIGTRVIQIDHETNSVRAVYPR